MATEVKNIILDIQAKVNNANAQMAKFASEIDKTEKELASLTKGTLAYMEAERKLISLQRQVNAEIGATEKATNNLNNTFSKARNGLVQFGAIAGVGLAFGDAVNTVVNFDQALADLSAITGATGGDLDFLKEQAREFGRTTTVSAQASVDAFKLIASAKPELLQNSAALAETTRQAILLSEASGDDLPKAATNLTAALNQYNAEADQAAKFTNVLAASAKFGSAEIPQVTDALLVFGSAARANNITIEESAALIETLAEKGKVGAEAGTAIRNILLTLSAPEALPKEAIKELNRFGISIDTLKDKSIPFADKLAALKPLIKDNAAAVNLFGKENVVAAQNLIENTDRVKELTEQVTDTNAAQEAAETRTNSLSGAFTRLKNSYDDFILNASNSTGTFTSIINFLAENLGTILSTLTLLGTTFVLYKTYTLAATAATKLFGAAQVNAAGETTRAAGSVRRLMDSFRNAGGGIKGFGALLKGIPFNVLLTGITLIGGALFSFVKGLFEASFATRKLKEAQEEFGKEVARESAGLNTLFEQLKKTTAGSKERDAIIKQLQERYPDYVKNLKLENASLKEIEAAQKAANEQLTIAIALKIKQQKIEEITAGQIERQFELGKKLGNNIAQNQELANKFITALKNQEATNAAEFFSGGKTGKDFDEAYRKIFNDARFKKLTNESKKKLQELAKGSDGFGGIMDLSSLVSSATQNADEKEAIDEITKFFDGIINKAKPTENINLTPDAGAGGTGPKRLTPEQENAAKKLAEDRKKLALDLQEELRKAQEQGQDIDLKNSTEAEIEKLKMLEKLNAERIKDEIIRAKIAAAEAGTLTEEVSILYDQIRMQRLINNEKEIQGQITKIIEDEAKKREETLKNIELTDIDKNLQDINLDETGLEQQKEKLIQKLSGDLTSAQKAGIEKDIQNINDLIISDLLEKQDELINKINIQEQFDLKFAKSEEERVLIAKKAAIERAQVEIDTQAQIDKLEQDKVDKDKKQKEQLKEAAKQLFTEVLNFGNELLNAQIAQTDRLIAAQQERVDKAAEIAEKGNSQLLELEQKRLDELEKKREKFVRRQQALALIELAANSAIAVAKAAAEGGAAAPITIAATLIALAAGIAQAISVANSTSFADGGYTGDGDRLTPSRKLGARGYTYHKGEYIIPKSVVQIGRNRDILEQIHRGRMDIDQEMNKRFYHTTLIQGGIDEQSVERIVRAIKSIPATEFNFDKEGIFTAYKKTDDHNKRVRNKT